MRQEPRRLSRISRVILSTLVVGAVVLAVETYGPSLQAQTPHCAPGVQEAEAGLITGFDIVSDAGASGGAYIHVPDGVANRWTPTEEYRASYCFTVDTPGRYRIVASVWADGGTNDSFFVAVDGLMVESGRWDVAHTNFGLDRVNSYRAADPIEIDLAAGEHTVDVYLREDGTRLDSIALEPVEGDASCTGGWADAESAHLEGFEVIRERGAHANQAIWVPEGSGSRWYPSAGHRAVFCFTVQRDGIYRLEADVYAPSTTSDSFFVKVDGGEAMSWYPSVSTGYVTDLVNAYGVADPMEFNLAAGHHVVEVFLREDGTRLDRMRFVEREAPHRRDCASDRVEAEAGALTGFVVGDDGTASGGAYIHVPNGNGSSWSPSDAVSATYCFNVRQAGTYQIVAGAWADNGTNDSFWVRVDAAGAQRWDVAWNTEYATDVIGFAGADPYVVDLGRGDHTVEILLREDGTRLDWIGLERLDQ